MSGSLLLAVLVAWAGNTVPAQGQAQPSPAAVDRIVHDLDQPGMPGCAFGVVENGTLVLSRSYGLADVENGTPIDSETRFDIGSMSKQFLAMSIQMLAADGKLLLDEEVHKYVPELPPYPWRITLRDLLHHTSGLKDYDQLLRIAGWRDGDVKSVDDIHWIIGRQKQLAFEPGTRYAYSDTNYFLLGLIAQRVTGKPLANLLNETIFQPLGMTHTSLHVDHWSLVPHKAWPYAISDGKPRLFINAEEALGDGGIFSTVEDLALWERNFDDARVGGAGVIDEMHQVRPLINGAANNYASGLYLRTDHGLRMIEHSGTSFGYQADKLRFPDRRLSVIVLCNRRDGTYVNIGDRLADLYLGSEASAGDSVPVSPNPHAPQTPKAQLERFAGTYFSDEASDGVLLEARDGALFDAGEEREYRQTGPLTFVSSSAGTLCRCSTTYTFRLGKTGGVLGFSASRPSGTSAVDQTVAVYKRTAPAMSAALANYTGEYVSEELATSWCLFEKDGALFVRRRGFADRPLHQLWEDAVDGPGGVLQFQRKKGRVVGFRLRNPRLNYEEFRKLPAGRHPTPAPWVCPCANPASRASNR